MSAVREHTTSQSTWKFEPRKDNLFTGDQVIDAYLKGKRDGLQAHHKTLLNQLHSNVEKCADDTAKLVNFIRENNFSPKFAYLKINSLDCMEVIIAVPESDFTNMDFLKVYEYLPAFENAIASDVYTAHFSFLDFSDNINDEILNSEGYIFKHQINEA